MPHRKPTYEELLQLIEKLEREKQERDFVQSSILRGEDLHFPESEVSNSGIDLESIINTGEIQAIFEDLHSATNMLSAIVDLKGKVLVAVGWQDICLKFHRIHPETARHCTESDLFLAENLKPGEYVSYKCKNGLWDVVTPLYVGDSHVGNVYTGQFFYEDEEINEERFLKQAEVHGFDSETYMKALRKVPRYSRESIRNLMNFLIKFTSYISRVSYANVRLGKEVLERKKAETALREGESLRRNLFNAIPDMVWLKDVDGVYLACNGVFETVFGAKEKDVIGKTDFDLVGNESGSQFRKYDELVMKSGKTSINEEEITYAHDGHHELLETIKTPIYGPDGELAGVLGIGRNITERKKFEIVLRESERLLNEVGQIAKVGGWEMDLLTRKAKWTQGTYDIVEIEYSKPVPGIDEHLDYYLPEYRPLIENAMTELIRNDKPLFFDAQLLTVKGNVKWCRAIGRAVRENGQCVKLYGTFQDITEVKKAEEQIKELNRNLELRVHQRTVELAEANKELEDFVYSVSHDLRAPLRSISGFAEIINRRHKESLNEEGQHYFSNIIKAGGQMGELIDDLLRFSRLGGKAMKSVPVKLDDVFKGVLETIADLVEETGAVINISPDMPVITGDATLAANLFINLFDNAIKYRKPEVIPIIDVSAEIDGPSFVITVKDNGIGIEQEHHEKVFKIFQRLHSQEDYPGTGIGLAAVKKAVQIMNGEVWVESEPGKGSVFRVKLNGEKESMGEEND